MADDPGYIFLGWLTIGVGFLADLAASIVYVPSEVLKTRLQLQGRYNNPYFHSGYNYRGTFDAFRSIVRNEGAGSMFSGYQATLARDLPFSALQFAFYEQLQHLAKEWVGPGKEIGMPLEIATAASAGGVAGVLTCPLDVIKTQMQTQPAGGTAIGNAGGKPTPAAEPPPSSQSLPAAMRQVWRAEGVLGWFRGVGPRFVWTSIQSGTMLVLFQVLLRKLAVLRQRWEEWEEGSAV